MNKMTLSDLKGLFLPPPVHYISPDGLYDLTNRTNWGSKRHARHNHKQAFKPRSITTARNKFQVRAEFISPAEYRRRHLGIHA